MENTPNANKFAATSTNPYTAYVAAPESVTDEAWCLDTGASHHVTNDLNQLNDKNKYNGKVSLSGKL